jgi:hypothetical protein
VADGKGEMIHNTCPCCEVSRPPHRDDCTFAVDCPEACADFDYVANLRLTDEERVDVAMWLSECLRQCSLAADGGSEEVAERWRLRSERAAQMLERLR